MMNSSLAGDNPRALEEYLCDLICELKRPEETDLLMEVLLALCQPPQAAPKKRATLIRIDRPVAHKQGAEG